MAKYHHTEGICLRRIDYSNTSQVASFLTPYAGRLSVIAKGVTRAPKRGIRTGFDLLGRYEIIYAERRTGSLNLLTYRWLREPFRGLRESPERILCAYYAAELALNLVAEDVPCPELYRLVVEALRSFAEGRALGINVLRLELAALEEAGSLPALDCCASCGGPLPAHGVVAFNAAEGGALCQGCEEKLDPPHPARTRHAGRELLRAAAALSVLAPGQAATVTLPPRRTVAASGLLRFYMRYMLGREMRMWKYLDQRRLSRSLARVRRRAGIA